MNNNRYSRYDYYDIRSIYYSYIFAVATLVLRSAIFPILLGDSHLVLYWEPR